MHAGSGQEINSFSGLFYATMMACYTQLETVITNTIALSPCACVLNQDLAYHEGSRGMPRAQIPILLASKWPQKQTPSISLSWAFLQTSITTAFLSTCKATILMCAPPNQKNLPTPIWFLCSVDIVFSTAHKSKGLEFNTVKLTDDYLESHDNHDSSNPYCKFL